MLLLEVLSPRQKQVLKGIMRGESNLEIGLALELSEGAIKFHVGRILEIYQVLNRSQLILKVAEIDPKAWD